MFIQQQNFRRLLFIGALLPLTACGGAPSEGDVHQALTKAFVADIGRQKGALTAEQTQKLDDMVKKTKLVGCKEDGEKAYKCEFSIDVGEKSAKDSARFIKGDRGWEVARK